MKRFHYAALDENKNARILSIYDNENIVKKIKDFNFVIVHPCATFKEAVVLVEAWKRGINK